MNDAQVLDIVTDAMLIGSKLAGPLLLTALAIGVVVSLFQTVTQIQEMTLSFVPKVIGIAAVLVIAGNWMLRELVNYATQLWTSIPALIGA